MSQQASTAAVSADDLDSLLGDGEHAPHTLLPTLHAIQDSLGHIPPDAVPRIAAAFNLSHADVQGVLSFYPHFRAGPPARHTLQLCQAEACLSMGAAALLAQAGRALGCGLHGRSADGACAIAPVYCLGQCATAPALLLDERLHARVSPARLAQLLAGIREAP